MRLSAQGGPVVAKFTEGSATPTITPAAVLAYGSLARTPRRNGSGRLGSARKQKQRTPRGNPKPKALAV